MSSDLPPPPTSLVKKYNFSQAWTNEDVVFGAERPGFIHPKRDQPTTPRGPDVNEECIQEWIQFMLNQGVRHVLCLLTREELRFYATSLLELYQVHFETVTHVDFTSEWQLSRILGCLVHSASRKERIVVHCTTGQTRTANVLALWLHRQYKQSIDDAVANVIQTSIQFKTLRMPTADGVMKLLMSATSIPLSARLSRPLTAKGTTSSADICFIQMGGRIDATPSATSESHLDISDAALTRILTLAGCTAAVDILSVCKKYGQDIQVHDLETLQAAISHTNATLIVITIGIQAMASAGEYLYAKQLNKTIILTGALVPAIMVASDAAFNVGCAIGAIRFLKPGVYTCLHGCVQSIKEQTLVCEMQNLSLIQSTPT